MTRRKACHVLPILLLLLSQCTPAQEEGGWAPEDFPNLIHLQGVPDSAWDLTAFAFSDLGAWHMYGLPDPEMASEPGSFPGPFLLFDGGVWLSPSLMGLQVTFDGESVPLVWDSGVHEPAAYLPGLLRQELKAGPVSIRMDLFYASPEVAYVRAILENRGDEKVGIGLAWWGGPFLLDATLSKRSQGVDVLIRDSGTRVQLGAGDRASEVEVAEGGYRIRNGPFSLLPEETDTTYLRIRVDPDGDGGGNGVRGWTFGDAETAFEQSRVRWRGYLSAAVGPRGSSATTPGQRERVAMKALQTLLSNWRAPFGHLRHAGLFPSYAYRGFHGIWSWDSWKHARALALFAPELAKEQMRVMFDFQNEAGMVPDVIYADSTENNWRDTKPPLAAWAVHGILQATGDTVFVGELLPALLRYHRWWYRDRDHDGNGLCEYGSTDGTRIAAAWESGMDNAVRFDSAVMVQNGPGAWSLDQESVDLNAYLFAEKRYLAALLEKVGRGDEAQALREEADALGERIRETFFHEESGFFYDVRLETKEPIRVQGPEGWIPLWAGLATEEQAREVARVMMDPRKFLGTVPLPTLAMDHPEFDPSNGYWRGPVWLDQAYFGIQGLRAYGLEDEALELSRRLVNHAHGLEGRGPVFENYHPETGQGLNAPHFSWSAAHLLMLTSQGFLDAERKGP